MSKYCHTIFDYIEVERSNYKKPIRLNDAWSWSMPEHLKTSENYTFSQLANREKDQWTPVKNITRPILNLQHRAEDIDVKDVDIYVDNPDKYHLSLLVKKYHDDVFVVENNIDQYFDELNVSRIDMGGGLSKKLSKPAPEVVPLQSIEFCNQVDMLSAPIGLKHTFGVDQLYDMEKWGWGNKENGATHSVYELVSLWREQENPGDGIKIIEVHGNLPARFATGGLSYEEGEKYESRIFIVCEIQPKGGEKKGIILFTAIEEESPFKLVKRDPIYGRALGFGGAEELFEPQVWTNYDEIRMQNMLDAAAVTIIRTTDPTLKAKHPKGLKNMKNLEIIETAPNTETGQLDTFPRNLALFEKRIISHEQHAKDIGGAQDPIQGKEPTAGTPFASLQIQVQQGMGLHDYRRKQFARHLEEIYTDWIIPHIQKKICEGFRFLTELSVEEMQYVADRMAVNAWNTNVKEKILNGESFEDGEQEAFIEKFKSDLKSGGNKRFLEALKGEFKGSKLSVKVSVAGNAKNLAETADKLSKAIQFVMSTYNPQTGTFAALDDPRVAKMINDLWEVAGLDHTDFANGPKKAPMPQQAQPAQPSPVQPAPVAP